MHTSLTELLHGIIDYAGLFPPAKLDMPTTVTNFASYVACDDAWMLKRLIVPVGRLDEFQAAAASLLPMDGETTWHLSGLTVPAGDPAFAANIEVIDAFNRRHADPSNGSAIIDTIELKGTNVDVIEEALDELPDEIFPFFEIPWNVDPRGMIATLVGSDAGAKIRTGGVTADLYPPVDAVARFIVACARAGVPFKATAGLHHPFRHYSDAVDCDEHGFFNVFLAAAIAYAHEEGEDAIAPVLEQTDHSAFRCTDDSIVVGDYEITADEIARTRDLIAISFGSCSFDEPRDDLREISLL
ncbi:MAG: hypothetical protein AAF432_09875 [Planctomycetota bacterium]